VPKFFVWRDIRGFVKADCPICARMFGFERGDTELETLFDKPCVVKKVLEKRGFDLSRGVGYETGVISYDKMVPYGEFKKKIGFRFFVHGEDLGVRRLMDIERAWGEEARELVLIERFSVVNLTLVPRYAHIYKIVYLPAFSSPLISFGVTQAIITDDDIELEKLLFIGGSKLEPRIEEATIWRG